MLKLKSILENLKLCCNCPESQSHLKVATIFRLYWLSRCRNVRQRSEFGSTVGERNYLLRQIRFSISYIQITPKNEVGMP